MKNIGIECEIPPNQLRQGFGTPICIVLLSLVNKVIQKNNFSFKKPRLEEKKSSNKEEGLEIEDEMPDLINNEIDYGDEANEKNETKNAQNQQQADKGVDDGSGILFSNISPEEWQRELEKVSSKLKFDPDSRAVLENLSSEIDKSLDKIMKKEEQLSKNHENIISDYKERHKDRNEQINEYQQLNEEVEEMRREVEDVTDKIAQANEKYDNLSKKISDTSKVGNTKQAILNLQNENISLDMKINILNHSILKYTLDPDMNKMINTNNEQAGVVDDTSMYEEVV